MNELKTILVPLFLVAQVALVHWTGGLEHPPPNPDLAHFPSSGVGDWQKTGEEPVDLATKAQLGADQLVNANFLKKPSGQMMNLFVAWFQSQRSGTSQPHSPQVCLPASGWAPEANGLMEIETSSGKITVNRYVIAKGPERAVVLYWYQTPKRVIAGEWAAKFWLMADAFSTRRTDTSLVRVTAWVRDSDASATDAARVFAQNLYPMLRQALPQ